jgi:hypothetical protein
VFSLYLSLLQAGEEVSKMLFQMKAILYGDGGECLVLTFSPSLLLRLSASSASPTRVSGSNDSNAPPPPPSSWPSRHAEAEPQPEQVAQLAQEVYNNDVLQLLVANIWRFEFEVRRP